MTRTATDRHRHDSHSDVILRMLAAAGARGVTNVQMWDAGLRYPNSRISDLRKRHGLNIETKREGRGVFRYVLIENPPPKPKTTSTPGRSAPSVPLPVQAYLPLDGLEA